jgi:hypothetical protein
MSGHALSDGANVTADDENAAVLTNELLFEDYAAAALGGVFEAGANSFCCSEVEAIAASVIAVERFRHDGVAKPLRRADNLCGHSYDLVARHRQARVRQERLCEALVARNLDRNG